MDKTKQKRQKEPRILIPVKIWQLMLPELNRLIVSTQEDEYAREDHDYKRIYPQAVTPLDYMEILGIAIYIYYRYGKYYNFPPYDTVYIEFGRPSGFTESGRDTIEESGTEAYHDYMFQNSDGTRKAVTNHSLMPAKLYGDNAANEYKNIKMPASTFDLICKHYAYLAEHNPSADDQEVISWIIDKIRRQVARDTYLVNKH